MEDIPHEGDICKEDEAEEIQGTCTKLSAIHAIKRDISVATARSTCGTNPTNRETGPHILVKDAKQ